MRAGALLIFGLLAASGAAAQTLPATDGDLLTPPDLRTAPGATAGTAAPAKQPKRTAHIPKVPEPAMAEVPRPKTHPAASEHPVDVGVVMRGGSATPRLYAPTGNSQAVQESGNAFGAAMRFGF